MIKKENIIPVGKFQRTHALKGELNAILDIDPEFFEEGYPIIVDIDGIKVPFYAEGVRPKGTSSFLIKLQGVDSEEEARQFVNKEVYAEREELSEFLGEEFQMADDLKGFKIVDETHGELGVLEEVDDSTDNALFVVRTPQGNELLIPVVDAFILSVDEENGAIHTSVPRELLDINSAMSDGSEQ